MRKRDRRVLGTIKKGRVKVYSKKQIGYLHHNKIDHTHYKYRGGKLVAKKRHLY